VWQHPTTAHEWEALGGFREETHELVEKFEQDGEFGAGDL